MTGEPPRCFVAGRHSWNRTTFSQLATLPIADWHYIASPAELNVSQLLSQKPRYIFFLHWSERVPAQLYEELECVCFHMTDVPYGRGGSPLQNLIARGHGTTQLTALRMIKEFDAGPVYFKRELPLHGTAEEIYIRAGTLAAAMIEEIIRTNPVPIPQQGEATYFTRRRPEQSRLPEGLTLQQAYDHIRMLDAEGYPHAFLEQGGLRFEFRRASLRHGRLEADVRITPHPPQPS